MTECEYEKDCVFRKAADDLLYSTKGTSCEKDALLFYHSLDHLCENYKISCPLYRGMKRQENKFDGIMV